MAKNQSKQSEPKAQSKIKTEQTDRSLEQTEDREKPSTDYLINDIAWHNTLFHDQYQEPWISIGGSGYELYPIGSRAFKRWLGAYVYKNYHFVLKNNQLRDIATALEGIAIYGGKGEKALATRTHFDGNVLWYDLGDSSVRIDRNGWKVVKDTPIMFNRYSHQEKQVLPEKGGDVNTLRQFVNVGTDDDWILFLTFAITAFIPGFPKPMLVMSGSQGAGKSTPMRILKKLVDPSILTSCGTPSTTDELSRLANRHALLFFDNLSSLPGKVSDDLCRLITGDGFSKRMLYTNDDETIFVLKRAVMTNGINNFITRADLLDRCILLEVKRIEDDKRISEDELWTKFEKERPGILGGIFDVISRAIALYPDVQTTQLPRMADFYKWGDAINWAIGERDTDTDVGDGEMVDGGTIRCLKFSSAYYGNIRKLVDEAIYANPVALAAIQLAESKTIWEGTASDFFDKFQRPDIGDVEAKYLPYDPMWPKSPNGIGRSLKRAEASLKGRGIEVTHFRKNNQRMLRITNVNSLQNF